MMRLLAHLDLGPAVLAAILGAAVQVTIVVLLGAVLARAAFKKRADARHALWLGVLICVLLSPLIAALLDRSGIALWRVALLPVPSRDVAAAPVDVVSSIAELEDVDPVEASEQFDLRPTSGGISRNLVEARAGLRGESGTRGGGLVGALSLLWAAGVLVGFTRIAWGWRQLMALSGAARPLEIARHGPTLERVRTELQVQALPPIEISGAAQGPVSVGLLRPRVVLPEGMVESISESTLRDVLVHECAHVLRRDSWVGLLQRLAGALFWPHPWVHYLNGQLTRACEEVCDNHVLRCGDACSYARTLVALTALCRPTGLTRPGIGLLGARWTLADRVAGLLDPGRVSMTRASIRTKVVLGLVLGVVVLSGASVRVGNQAPAEQPKATQAVPNAAAPASPNSESWNVDGVVVDEQGRPVAGAVVRTMPVVLGTANVEQQTGADGTFRFTRIIGSPTGLVGLIAEADGGARMGVDPIFYRRRAEKIAEPVRIILKPSRAVTVRVTDGAGLPVPGAKIEAAERLFRTRATAGPDGTATLRVPADARVKWIVAFKPRVGLDYFENFEKRGVDPTGPPPAEVVLTLEAAPTVRIKAVDSKGQPVAGVGFKPVRFYVTGKKDSLDARLCGSVRAVTDGQGVATFDWFPKGRSGPTTFSIDTEGGYSCLDPLEYESSAPSELTARVRRATRISGTVRLPDGRPARQIQVKAAGWGSDTAPPGMRTTRTGENGRYELDVAPELVYMVAVVDDTWAAESLKNVIVREGQSKDGLDFALIKGTLLRG